MHNWHDNHYFGSPHTETSNEQAVVTAVLLTVVRRTTALPTIAPAASAVSVVAAATPLPAATTPPTIVLACGEGGVRLHNSGFSEKKFALQIHVDFLTF